MGEGDRPAWQCREQRKRPKAGDTRIAGKALAPKRRGALQGPHRLWPRAGGLTAGRQSASRRQATDWKVFSGPRDRQSTGEDRSGFAALPASWSRLLVRCTARPALRFRSSTPEKKKAEPRTAPPGRAGQAAPKAAISTAADWRATVAAGGVGAS